MACVNGAWASSPGTKLCGTSDLAVEIYALGGAIRPQLADALFESKARSNASQSEQDFAARGGDLGFSTPFAPILEGGAIVFPCRFFGIGVHGGGSWRGSPDASPSSPQLAQRAGGEFSMMRMSVSIHSQLPISRFFALRASVLLGYRNYSLAVSGTGPREALIEQVSLEPRIEARVRLPLAVPFGFAAFVGGEVLSVQALTVGGGLFLATDWPAALSRKPRTLLGEKTGTEPLPSEASTLPVLASPIVSAPIAPPPAVSTPAAPPEVSAPVAPPLVSPPSAAPVMIDGFAFMDLTATGVIATQADSLNVRRRPQKTAPILGLAAKGSRVQITGVGPGWYRIDYQGNTGYVSADFVTRDP